MTAKIVGQKRTAIDKHFYLLDTLNAGRISTVPADIADLQDAIAACSDIQWREWYRNQNAYMRDWFAWLAARVLAVDSFRDLYRHVIYYDEAQAVTEQAERRADARIDRAFQDAADNQQAMAAELDVERAEYAALKAALRKALM